MELIKTEMTPKERAAAYARGEEVDRIPTYLSANETGCWGLLGIPYTEYYFSADAMLQIETFLAEETGQDNMGMNLGMRGIAEALGAKMHYPEHDVAYVEEPGINDLSEVEGLDFVDVHKDGRIPILIEAFKRLIDKYGDTHNIGCDTAGAFTIATNFFGTERFLKATRRNPEGIHRLLQFTTDSLVYCCRDLHDILGIEFSLAEPLGAKDVLSKKQFDEFFVPYLNQTVERLSKFQSPPTLHLCGVTHDRWKEVVDSGVGTFEVDNCESLVDLKQQFGNRLTIRGNVPPVDVLYAGTPEEIARDVRRCIVEAGDNPCGFGLSPACTTPVGTKFENLVAFMNAAAVYGRGARKGELPRGIVEGDELRF